MFIYNLITIELLTNYVSQLGMAKALGAVPCIIEGGHRTTLNLEKKIIVKKKWNSKLIWVVDHPGKKLDNPKNHLSILNKNLPNIINKISLLQNFGPLKIELKNCEKCYVHNMFSTLSIYFCFGWGMRNVAWKACLFIDMTHWIGLWFSVRE